MLGLVVVIVGFQHDVLLVDDHADAIDFLGAPRLGEFNGFIGAKACHRHPGKGSSASPA